jgi:hypothetical protein
VTTRPRRRFAFRRAVLVAVAVALTSCAEGASDAPGNGSTDGTTSDEITDEREEVALPAGGPVDPVVPPSTPAYELLEAGRCEELQDAVEGWGEEVVDVEGADTVELYRGAAHACLGEWDEAVEAFDRIGAPDFGESCPRDAVYAWLRPLIEARKANPSFEPEFVGSGGSSPCPTADADDEDEDVDEDDDGPTVAPTNGS